MSFTKIINETAATLKLEGGLDTSTAPHLEELVNECVQSCTSLTLDLEGLQYISSAGLRVLLKTQKLLNAPGAVRLIHVSSAIMEVFDITGFTDILTIE